MAPAPSGHRDEQATLQLLRLVLTPGLGVRTAHRLLQAVGGPTHAPALGKLQRDELQRLGLDRLSTDAVLDPASTRRAEEERGRARDSGTRIIPIGHAQYPALLMETVDPPLVLFVRGNFWCPERPHVAIVGARAASAYGLHQARTLAAGLAARGAIVVSGLARGIDTAAHQGALTAPAAQAATVAVLGTGVDRCYPPENHTLGEAIAGRGALVSEFPLGTPPLSGHFPRRNRIIAGLAWGTIVVEARERSGSLITARLAADANREVFAVPGPVDLEQSRGTHRLIRDGACLVTSVEDVVAEFGPPIRDALGKETDRRGAANEFPGPTSLSDSETTVLEALSTWEARPIDHLIDGLNLSIEKVYAALTGLELAGLVDTLPGERYVRRTKGRVDFSNGRT